MKSRVCAIAEWSIAPPRSTDCRALTQRRWICLTVAQPENVVAARRRENPSDAGRFNVSRQGKATVNDADRLRKYRVLV